MATGGRGRAHTESDSAQYHPAGGGGTQSDLTDRTPNGAAAGPSSSGSGGSFTSQFSSLPGMFSPRKGTAPPSAPPRKMNISAPTYDAAGSHAAFPSDSRIPPPPSHPGTLIPRPRTSSSPLYPAAYAIATQTRPPLPIPHTATVVAARFANNATNIRLKDRAQEWGKKGKGILEDRWKLTRRNSGGGGWAGGNPLDDHRRGQGSSSASTSADTASTASSTSSHHRGNPSVSSNFAVERASSPLGAADNPIKLPTTILGVRVPKRSGVAFGVELEIVVELTRIPVDGNYRRKNVDEVRGDDARKWLPAVAFRCFEYLDEWGRKEEGIYRCAHSLSLWDWGGGGVLTARLQGARELVPDRPASRPVRRRLRP